MDLGAFSVSLNVKDIDKSVEFYKSLGFEIIDGGHTNSDFKDTDDQKWRILSNKIANIGLFQGMFEENILSFNPKNVKKIEDLAKEKGLQILESTLDQEDPEFKTLIIADPDGNTLMFDEID